MTDYYAELRLDRSLGIQDMQRELARVESLWKQRRTKGNPAVANKKLVFIEEARAIFANEASRAEYDSRLDSGESVQSEGQDSRQESFERWRSSAATYLQQGNYDLAKASADHMVLYADAAYVDAAYYHLLAQIYVETRDFSLAMSNANQAIVMDPDSPDHYCLKGNIFLRAVEEAPRLWHTDSPAESALEQYQIALMKALARNDDAHTIYASGCIAFIRYFMLHLDDDETRKLAQVAAKYGETNGLRVVEAIKERERQERAQQEQERLREEQRARERIRLEEERRARERAEAERNAALGAAVPEVQPLLCRRPPALPPATVTAGPNYSIGLTINGTAVVCGENDYGQCNVSNWRNLVAVSAGVNHTVGLRVDGTAVACGDDSCSQCRVSDWRGLAAVSAGCHHTVGLRTNGTAVACGHDYISNPCDVSSRQWRRLVAVSAGYYHTVGLRSDGTAVACGTYQYGQCNVSNWQNLVAVSAGYEYTVGLRADGTAVACGSNEYGQCNVSNWRNLVAISAGSRHTVGILADGSAVACGDNENGKCNVSSWRGLVAISASASHTIGLLADGTVVACGAKTHGQCEVQDWRLFSDVAQIRAALSKPVYNPRVAGIMERSSDIAEMGLDGAYEKLNDYVSKKLLADDTEVCPYCGGSYEGRFIKRCSSCGRLRGL